MLTLTWWGNRCRLSPGTVCMACALTAVHVLLADARSR